MSTAPSLITFHDFLEIPDTEGEKLELIEGEVVRMPPPVPEHSDIALRIQRFLTEKIGWSRVRPDATGYRIGESCLIPDVSVQWENQRRDQTAFLGAPMIAVEILSPREEIDSKITLYLRGGAAEVWVVNPKLRTLVIYTSETRVEVTSEHQSEATGQNVAVTDIFG